MIRINLLGKPKQKSKRAAMGAGGGGGEFEAASSPMINVVAAAAVLAISVGSVLFMQGRLQKQADTIKSQMAQAERESQQLAQTKASFLQRQKIHDEYENHVKVIDALRASQSGPVDLLTMVSSTVNSTDQVWLASLDDSGDKVNVEGTALSANAVANLMTNLMKTGYFKSVEIKETYQDEQEKKLQAFNFSLICAKQPKKS
jgi:Tfp pilus assembly protein PilN